jgi:hypothetical protein
MLYVFTVDHELRLTKEGEYRITDLKDLPLVQNVYIRHWEEGLAALGVIDEFTLSIVRSAAWQAGTTFPVLQDKHGEIRQRYSGYGDSSVFFIAPDGTILKVIQGQTSEDAYEAGVKKLLEYRDAHQ